MGQWNCTKAKAARNINVESVPDEIIDDASAAQKFVGAGNMLRIEGTAAGYVMFQVSGDTTAAGAATKNTLKTAVGFIFVVVPEGLDYIRTSAAMRIEITKD